MNYANYDRSIIQKYKVKLVGWPTCIPFGSPHNICTVDEVSALRHLLKDKTCHWTLMTDQEVTQHMRSTILREADLAVQIRKRKVRSDKGKRRGKTAAKNNGGPTHKERKEGHKRLRSFKSRTIISSSDDESHSGNGTPSDNDSD
jgi:hypothetical protein